MNKSRLVIVLLLLIFLINAAVAREVVSHDLLDAVLKDYVKEGRVNYSALREDGRLDKYLETIANVNPAKLKDDKERLALWINAYNGYTLQLIKDNYPVKSINDLHSGGLIFGTLFKSTAWDKKFAKVNKKKYTLNQIEHKIIRPKFKDPRIHFALVCAAKSCPPLRPEAYEGHRLDKQLDDQARVFLNNPKLNTFNADRRSANVTSILSWYGKDFGKKTADILLALEKYLPDEVASSIKEAPKKWKMSFKSYDWSLNDNK